MRVCAKCGVEKPLGEFHRSGKYRRYDCRSCRVHTTKAYRQQHPEQVKAAYTKWRRANPEKARASYRRWAAQNPKRVRDSYREWRRANPEGNRRRRRLHHAAQGNATTSDAAYVEVLTADPCSYCGAPMEHLDHIDSLSHGGAGSWENLTAACADCNMSKQAKPLLAFLLHRG